jgi:hypothetical protein
MFVLTLVLNMVLVPWVHVSARALTVALIAHWILQLHHPLSHCRRLAAIIVTLVAAPK